MFMPANDVNTVAEWQRSHVIPTLGTCVSDDGDVAEPAGSSGVVFGW
jgi:hypothetical protein